MVDGRLARNSFSASLTIGLRNKGFFVGGQSPAEGQNLSHQFFGPVTGLQHLIQVFPHLSGILGAGSRHFRKTHDNPQEVIEIVGNTARQGADGLHLLRLEELLLQFGLFRLGLLALGDILDGAHQPPRPAVAVVFRPPETAYPAHLAADAPDAKFLG